MSEILKQAQNLEKVANEQSKHIAKNVNNELNKLNKHIEKQVQLSSKSIENAIKDHNKKSREALQIASYRAIPTLMIGVLLGASIVVALLALANKTNLITLTVG
ncbi:MAG: MbeB family mobilization protein [Pseudomonadota bacterium]|nr:MbeB family mobilization protein [Pseudomonadota bacterium]